MPKEAMYFGNPTHVMISIKLAGCRSAAKKPSPRRLSFIFPHAPKRSPLLHDFKERADTGPAIGTVVVDRHL